MQPSDSAAAAKLISDFDGDMTTRFLVDAYTAITSGTEDPTLGVVVERAGQDGLKGNLIPFGPSSIMARYSLPRHQKS
jgi:hypothetical protein